jgi:hypothetical protein
MARAEQRTSGGVLRILVEYFVCQLIRERFFVVGSGLAGEFPKPGRMAAAERDESLVPSTVCIWRGVDVRGAIRQEQVRALWIAGYDPCSCPFRFLRPIMGPTKINKLLELSVVFSLQIVAA